MKHAGAPRWLVALIAANLLFLAFAVMAALELSHPPWPDLPQPTSVPQLPPTPTPPADRNGAQLVLQAGYRLPSTFREQLSRRGPLPSDEPWPDGVPPDVKALVEGNAPSLDLIHRARDMEFALPERLDAAYMEAMRFLALAIRADLATGDRERAAGRLLDGLCLEARAMWEPGAGPWGTYLASSAIPMLLRPLDAEPDALSRLSDRAIGEMLEGLNRVSAMRRPVEDVQIAYLREPLLVDLPSPWTVNRELWNRVILSRVTPLRRRDFRRLHQMELDLVARQEASRGVRTMLFLGLQPAEAVAWFYLPCLREPTTWAPGRLAAEFDLDALRIRLAAERFRRDRGRTPTGRVELAPLLGAPWPEDPFAPGRPLYYGAGRIWSVGPDGLDDGGRVRLSRDALTFRGRVREGRGDLVAP